MTSLQARSIRGGRLGSHAEEPMSLQPRRQRPKLGWSDKTLERACEGADFVSRPVATTHAPEDTFPIFRRNYKIKSSIPQEETHPGYRGWTAPHKTSPRAATEETPVQLGANEFQSRVCHWSLIFIVFIISWITVRNIIPPAQTW